MENIYKDTYISKEEAANIVFEHSKISNSLPDYRADFDYADSDNLQGAHYTITFEANYTIYEYIVDAITGEILTKKNKNAFDGKLKKEELILLKESLIMQKNSTPEKVNNKIKKIEVLLEKYKEHLTGFKDLVGDTGIPSNMFYFNIKHFGYLLEDDPEKVISKRGVLLRKYTTAQLIKHLGPLFLTSKQVFENRQNLLGKGNKTDNKIVFPREPVIWTPNHHFKDDVLATIIAEKRPAYMVFGSLPEFFNTFNGILAYAEGVLLVNRKVSSSRKALEKKVKQALSLKTDIFYCPEGVWNKTINQYVLELWHGIYKIAYETGTKLVPIIHYVYDPSRIIDKNLNPIHTVIDDPIDLTRFSEETGLRYYRDVMSTWYCLMSEKYGYTTREALMEYYTKRAIDYNDNLTEKDFEKRKITSHEAWEIYLLDLMKTAERYDFGIESAADYRSRDYIRPEEVFDSIANIKNVSSENLGNILKASELVRTRKLEDYQRRY